MRRTLTGLLLALAMVVVVLPAWAVSFEPDPSFSDDGVLRWPLKDGTVTSLAADGDQILAAGRSEAGKLPRLFIVRLDEAGTFDETFGNEGTASVVAQGMSTSADIWALGDGRVLTAYNHKAGVVVHRWTAAGALDTTFSGDGERMVRFEQTGLRPIPQLVVDGDGRIVVAGMVEVSKGHNAVIARLMPDGGLDTTLDGDGTTSVNLGYTDWVDALAVDGHNKILLGTDYWDPDLQNPPGYAAVVRLRQNGSIDTSFSNNGVVRFRMISRHGVNYPVDISVDGSGVITVPAVDGGDAYGAVRLLPDGSFDDTYGHDGRLSINCECGLFNATVDDGRVAFVGNKAFNDPNGYDDTTIVVRISADGTAVDRRHFDLFPGDEREGANAVLIDGSRTVIGGLSLRHPYVARLG